MLQQKKDDIFGAILNASNGDIERAVDGTKWKVPRITLRDGKLSYYFGGSIETGPLIETGPSKGLLPGFLKLAEAPEDQILRFARRFGVLGLCRHGVPRRHHDDCFETVPESLAVWRAFSREAFSLTRIADRLLDGRIGNPTDWKFVFARTERDAPWWKQDLDMDRHMIARVVNFWLRLGDVRPVVLWESRKPALKLGSNDLTFGLFGALALQLALAVGQSSGFAVCVHCRREYPPTARRPKVGQRNFCPECRALGVPTRYSVADFRKRKRGD